MVEAVPAATVDQQDEEQKGYGQIELPADFDYEDSVAVKKGPMYLDSIEKEIERMFENAMVDMSEVGIEFDQGRKPYTGNE